MENTAPPPGGSDRTGRPSATGSQYGRQRPRPMVSRPGQGPLGWALQCVLQLARTSDIDGRGLAQPTRTAVYGPVRTVVWQGPAPYAGWGGRGRGPTAAPMPIKRRRQDVR